MLFQDPKSQKGACQRVALKPLRGASAKRERSAVGLKRGLARLILYRL